MLPSGIRHREELGERRADREAVSKLVPIYTLLTRRTVSSVVYSH